MKIAAEPVSKSMTSSRPDGRFVETAGFTQAMIKSLPMRLAFDSRMRHREFADWQSRLRAKVLELMVFPEVREQPQPRCVKSEERKGYKLQRWEAYPEPDCTVPFLMLVPNHVCAANPAAAVMCFPGYSGSKESMAGEPELNGRELDWSEEKRHDNQIALHLVRSGMIAVAIDNPARCEAESDLRGLAEVARCFLWAGRNYLGVSVFQKCCILEWLSQLDIVDARRIATCGLSLGSLPADIVALLNPDRVAAVVHNDFLCHWRERTIAMSAYSPPDWHIVPGMYRWFDAPDIEAALAPRPLLFTEGGRSVHIERVRSAYALLEAHGDLEVHYYKKYADPDARKYDDMPIPEGISMEEYFEYANVDVENHRFHPEHIVPWLEKVLQNG